LQFVQLAAWIREEPFVGTAADRKPENPVLGFSASVFE